MTGPSAEQLRNRRLAANIAAGSSPLTPELIETMRRNAAANLDVPGPRVLQLLDELAENEGVIKLLRRQRDVAERGLFETATIWRVVRNQERPDERVKWIERKWGELFASLEKLARQ